MYEMLQWEQLRRSKLLDSVRRGGLGLSLKKYLLVFCFILFFQVKLVIFVFLYLLVYDVNNTKS